MESDSNSNWNRDNNLFSIIRLEVIILIFDRLVGVPMAQNNRSSRINIKNDCISNIEDVSLLPMSHSLYTDSSCTTNNTFILLLVLRLEDSVIGCDSSLEEECYPIVH